MPESYLLLTWDSHNNVSNVRLPQSFGFNLTIQDIIDFPNDQQIPNWKPWPQNHDMNRTVDFVNFSTPDIHPYSFLFTSPSLCCHCVISGHFEMLRGFPSFLSCAVTTATRVKLNIFPQGGKLRRFEKLGVTVFVSSLLKGNWAWSAEWMVRGNYSEPGNSVFGCYHQKPILHWKLTCICKRT